MKHYLSLLLAILICVPCSAQAPNQKNSATGVQASAERFSVRVRVEVEADESIKSRILSYVKRELRSLSDVVLTDDNPKYRIEIVGIEEKTVGGLKSGISLSFIIAEQLDNNLMENLLSRCILVETRREIEQESKSFAENLADALKLRKTLVDSFRGYVKIRLHSLRTGPPDALREFLEEYVAKFDTEVLEEDRMIWRILHPAK